MILLFYELHCLFVLWVVETSHMPNDAQVTSNNANILFLSNLKILCKVLYLYVQTSDLNRLIRIKHFFYEWLTCQAEKKDQEFRK